MYIKSLTVCIIAIDISSVIATSLVVDDEFGRISGDPSETSSLAYSMDGEEDWIWGGEALGSWMCKRFVLSLLSGAHFKL